MLLNLVIKSGMIKTRYNLQLGVHSILKHNVEANNSLQAICHMQVHEFTLDTFVKCVVSTLQIYNLIYTNEQVQKYISLNLHTASSYLDGQRLF